MTAGLIAFAARLISGCRARWVDCEPSLTQRVYYGNHSSHLDALVIWSALPAAFRRQCRFVGAADYWNATAIRRYLARDAFHAILIDRTRVTKEENPLLSMLDGLEAGYSLVLFPEGGRKAGDTIGVFQGGIHHLARRRPQTEFVPVYLDNLNRVLPKGEVLPVPLISSATFGPPIQLAEGESKADFLDRARACLAVLGER